MKRLHRDDLYCWSTFDERLDIDFNSYVWHRPGGEDNVGGNVVIDPLPMSAHDREHLRRLGGARICIVTNADHVRAAAALIEEFGAELWCAAAERERIALPVARLIEDGQEVLPGLRAWQMNGSKTPGELALVLAGSAPAMGATLVTGDLVRAHRPNSLMLLPAAENVAAAVASLERLLAAHPDLEAVLVGDGWPLFREGRQKLIELIGRDKARIDASPPAPRPPRMC